MTATAENIRTYHGLSGSTLKLIAMCSMLIDHTAAVLLGSGADAAGLHSQTLCLLLRGVGRLAFPLYCFLLVEGFRHTRDPKKYLLRLLVFALISELPFDLALRGSAFDPGYQNVFFTLALGLAGMIACQKLSAKSEIPNWKAIAGVLAVTITLTCIADVCRTDYGGYGVALILALYLLRSRPFERNVLATGVLVLCSPLEICAFPCFLLFREYNGTKGNMPFPKLTFYAVYPAHLLLLALLKT